MIWHSVTNGYPETFCKCEVLVECVNGDLQLFFCEYDILMAMFLIPSISEETSGKYVNVAYWRAL